MTTPKVSAPELSTSQASKEATANEAFRRLEAGAGFYLIIDKDLTTPPGSCADGAQYIVGGGGGAWAGHIGDVAIAVGTNASNGWYFRDPEEGVFAWVQDENLLYYCTTATSPAAWAQYGNLAVEEGGVEESAGINRINFTGAGVSVSVTGMEATVTVPGGSGGSGAGNINDMDDVDTTGVANGDSLIYSTAVSPPQWIAGPPGPCALTILQRTTSQSITNSTWTLISWDTTAVQDDVSAFSAGSPTQLTVPSGYTKARITLFTKWENNSTGIRYSRVDVNSATVTLDMRSAQQESGATLASRWFTVSAGQLIQLYVIHTKGSNANLDGSSTGTTVQVEWAP